MTSYIDNARSAGLCSAGSPGYTAIIAVSADGREDFLLAADDLVGDDRHTYDSTTATATHEQTGPLTDLWTSRIALAPLRCGRRTKAGRSCLNHVTQPKHRMPTPHPANKGNVHMTSKPEPTTLPSSAFIVDNAGQLLGHMDIDKLQTDATLLMYEMACTAGDDPATDLVTARWVAATEPDYFGYLCAATLSLMTRHVLAPVLDVAAQTGVDLRPGLRDAHQNALNTLGRVSTATDTLPAPQDLDDENGAQ